MSMDLKIESDSLCQKLHKKAYTDRIMACASKVHPDDALSKVKTFVDSIYLENLLVT